MTKLASQELSSLLSPSVLDELIGVTMSHEKRCIFVHLLGFFGQLLDLIAHQEVAAEPKDACQLVRGGNTGEERHRTALGEPAQDDSVRGNTSCHFVCDELREYISASKDSHFVMGLVKAVQGGLSVLC